MKTLHTSIIQAGLVVGTMDILAAFIYTFIKSGNPHIPGILRFIASSIFGKQVTAGGSGLILAGLLFHYAIAFLFTVFFFRIYPKIKNLFGDKIGLGIV